MKLFQLLPVLFFLFIFNHVHAQYSVWSWGLNSWGQRGDGMREFSAFITPPPTNTPAPVTCHDDWKTLSASGWHALALRQDGTLWSWGASSALGLRPEQLDYAGGGVSNAKSVAAQIGADGDWVSMSTGGYQAAAIKTNGTLWTWGSNQYGELGDGSSVTERILPAQAGTATNWKQVEAGFTMLAVRTDGTLWSWGHFYLLGSGSSQSPNIPTRVGTDNDWSVIDQDLGSGAAAAIKTNGSLWTWGKNLHGSLGLGPSMTAIDYHTPQRVGTDTDWKSASMGSGFGIALKTNGSLWAWGLNDVGQVGDGTTTDRLVPIRIGTATDWAEVSAGEGYVLAVKTDGSLWAWGANLHGTLVYGNTPQRIGTANTWKQVCAGGRDFAIALNDSPHNPIPTPLTLGNDIMECDGAADLTPSITNAHGYLWSETGTINYWYSEGGNGGFVAVNSGTYRLVVNKSGCRSSDEVKVTLETPPPVTWSMQGSFNPNCSIGILIAPGESVTFTNTSTDIASHQYKWALSEANGTIHTATGSSYTVSLTDVGVHSLSLYTETPCSRQMAMPIFIQPKLSIGDGVIQSCQLPVTLSSNITDGNTYVWTKPDNSQVSGTHTLSADQSGTYKLSMASYVCTQTAMVRVDVAGAASLSFTPLGTTIPNCPGQFDQTDAVTFQNTTPQAATQDFTWTFGDGTTAQGVSPDHTYTAPGRYTVRLDANCGRTLTKDIYVQPRLSLGNDRIVCEPTAILTANVPNADAYGWETPYGTVTGQQSVTATTAGNYIVFAYKFGCVQSDEVMITITPFSASTDFSIFASDDLISSEGVVLNGAPIRFTSAASPELQFDWSLGDGTSAQEHSLEHAYAAVGDYTVKLTVTDNAGCTGSAEKYLQVEDILITDAISPNGDGKNDRLVVSPFLYDAELKVMDRAGRTVYHASPYNNDFSGENLESDVYYYELQFRELGKSYKGYVHVIK